MDPAALAELLRAAAVTEIAAANARVLVLRGAADLIDAHGATAGGAAAAAVSVAPRSRKRRAPASAAGTDDTDDASAGAAAGPPRRRARTADPLLESLWKQHYGDVLAWSQAGNLDEWLILEAAPARGTFTMTAKQADALVVLGVKHLRIKTTAKLGTFPPLERDNAGLISLSIDRSFMDRLSPTMNQLTGLTVLQLCGRETGLIDIYPIFSLKMLRHIWLQGTTTAVVMQLHRFRHLRTFENDGIDGASDLTVFRLGHDRRDGGTMYNNYTAAPKGKRIVNIRNAMACRTLTMLDNVRVAMKSGEDFDANYLLRYRTILRCSSRYWGTVPFDVCLKVADAAFPMCVGIPHDWMSLALEEPTASGASEAASSAAAAAATAGADV